MKKIICVILAVMLLSVFAPTAAAQEETYVFDEIREYLIQDSYVADDGYIGIPISVCTYCKLEPSKTNNDTDVIIYVLGSEIERIGTERDVDILRDLLDEGYIVITLDYLDDPAAKGEALIYSIKEFRKNSYNILQ